jgi:mono/diheme cytochrome c family protein
MQYKAVVVLGTFSLIAGAEARGAEGGEALYKAKCAACHGANGEGKPAMKAPGLKGTPLDASQLTDRLLQGQPGAVAPHSKGMPGVKKDQAKAIAKYIKSL